MHTPSHKARMQRALRGTANALFVIWVPLVLVAVTGLALAHWAALPLPTVQNPRLQRALAEQRGSDREPKWRLTHVLYGACACSKLVHSHLQARGVVPHTSEQVVFVGRGADAPASLLRARSFRVSAIEPSELQTRYGLEVAPLLIVEAPDHSIRYLGGYTERKQGPVIRDREILSALQRGEAAATLPVLGCAVSRALQDMLDPLGLKYNRKTN